MAEPISASLTAAGLTSAAAATTAASTPVLTSATAASFAAAAAGTTALTIPTATATLLASVGSALAPLATIGGTLASLAGAGMRVAGAQQQVIGAGQQAQAFAFQAQQERTRQQQAMLQSQSALLAGRSEASRVRQALMRTLAAQNARYAGAGLAVDEGTPATIAEDSQTQAEIELGIIDTNAQMAAADRQMAAGASGLNAAEYNRRGRDVLRSADSNLDMSIFDAADRVWQRVPGWTTSPNAGSRL